MYNGIGLSTVRGSGTSGYVQRNAAQVPRHRLDRTPREKRRADQQARRRAPGTSQGNSELIEHQRRRQIEVECMELREQLEDDGIDDATIDERVQELRQRLKAEGTAATAERSTARSSDTHSAAERKQREVTRLRSAFRIRDDYRDGEAFDPVRQQERAEQRRKEREERNEQRRKEREEYEERRRKEREEYEERRREEREEYEERRRRDRAEAKQRQRRKEDGTESEEGQLSSDEDRSKPEDSKATMTNITDETDVGVVKLEKEEVVDDDDNAVVDIKHEKKEEKEEKEDDDSGPRRSKRSRCGDDDDHAADAGARDQGGRDARSKRRRHSEQ